MILTALGDILGAGERPPRDLIVAFFADEENGGVYGSHYLVDNHPELFAGATEAISEVGGYSIDLDGTPRVPAADRREGPRLDQAHRARHDGARLAGHPRQRGHQARARRRSRSASWSGRCTSPRRRPRCSPSCATCSESSRRRRPRCGRRRDRHRGRVPAGDAARDLEPDGARGRLQAQRDPRPRRGAHRPAPVRRAGGRGAGAHPRGDRRRHRDRGACTTTSGSRCRSTGALVEEMVAALGRARPRRTRAAVPDERRHRQQGARQARHHGLRLRAAAADRPTSTSRRCSTASTSACRSSRWRSAGAVLGDLLRNC